MIATSLEDSAMPVPVKLSEIVEALDGANESLTWYLDKRTGEVILINKEEMSAVEEDEPLSDYSEWEQEQILKAREIFESEEHFLALPDQFEIHEYQIMDDFCRSMGGPVGDRLLALIRGSGAFGRFKNAIHSMGIQNDWYDFKRARLEEMAIEWLEDHEIPYTRDDVADVSGASM
jgi:Uncharacterised protein family (UPF0158)